MHLILNAFSKNKKDNLRVLFIEDNKDDVGLIVHELSKEYKVVWYRVETEAALLLALDENVFDIVLCDYKMPNLTPQRALEIVKNYLYLDLPFIIISGSVDESIAIDLLKAGANDFINKDNRVRIPLAVAREIRQARERMRARLKVEDSFNQMIEAWGKALELRDIYTHGHTVRVTDLTLRLAKVMNVSSNEFQNIYHGSLLHDIGKMGIPDLVLLKQSLLDEGERKVMEMHPVIAYELLSHIPYLEDAVNIPYCHHERWNGKGYPRGLMGDEIPFEARLFSIVDVYDALTSKRPYREPWDKAKAIDFILGERNISFDPKIVDAFVDMVGRG